MLLLLFAWFFVQNTQAQSLRKSMTPEQEKQWQDAVATNKMLQMRQNPPTSYTKQGMVEVKAESQQKVQIKQDAPQAEKELAVRKLMQKYDAGNIQPATGAVAIMEAQGVHTLAEVNLDKLSDNQKVQLFETEPTLLDEWKKYEQKLSQMDKKSQDQLRKQLWEQHKNRDFHLK